MRQRKVEEDIITGHEDPDVVTMDVPLFIRLLEFAREDAKDDVDLHKVAEKATGLMSSKKVLRMEDYDSLMSNVKTKKGEDILIDAEVESLKRKAGVKW